MISIVINCDTRKGFDEPESTQSVMLKGTRSYDFLYDGVVNKLNFFRGHETEVIVYVDKHEDIPFELHEKWKTIPNLTVCISPHKETFEDYAYFPKWNDMNFMRALYLARGTYVVHFDGDMNAFRADESDIVDRMISWLNKYDYVSYPSPWSPNPDTGDWDYWWASTRFFMCKRSTLNFTEFEKCLKDSNYLYGKYGDKKRKCPWLEHVLGIIAGQFKVFYPPVETENYAIFSWNHYTKGTLQRLNGLSYNEVRMFVSSHGISYPCDISC